MRSRQGAVPGSNASQPAGAGAAGHLDNGNGAAHRPRSGRRLPAPHRAGAAAEAERIPALRRRRDRPAAADLRLDLLRRCRRHLPARSTTCRSRPTTRSGPATRSSPAPGARSTSTTAARSTATACSTCRKVGSFNVAGVKAADLERNLRAQIGRLFTNFDLAVSLGQLRGLRVFIVGPAQRPGVVTLSSQSTLLSAVVAAGGPSRRGRCARSLLRRDGKVISELDVYEFLVQGDKSKDVQLAAGDVVVFQPAGPRVAAHRRDRHAGDLRAEERAGADPRRAALCRRRAGARQPEPGPARADRSGAAARHALRRDLPARRRRAADARCATATSSRLLPISPQFANAVTLKGHVAAAAALSVHARACASAT